MSGTAQWQLQCRCLYEMWCWLETFKGPWSWISTFEYWSRNVSVPYYFILHRGSRLAKWLLILNARTESKLYGHNSLFMCTTSLSKFYASIQLHHNLSPSIVPVAALCLWMYEMSYSHKSYIGNFYKLSLQAGLDFHSVYGRSVYPLPPSFRLVLYTIPLKLLDFKFQWIFNFVCQVPRSEVYRFKENKHFYNN